MNLAFKTSVSCLSVLLLTSCGKAPENNPGKNLRITESVRPDGSNVEGNYIAKLWPVNLNLEQAEVGVANFNRTADNFTASVNFKIGTPNAWHKQGIFVGTRCPNLSDDKNGDAYIDYEEAKAAFGQLLIPLDDDINTQDDGKNRYPMANESGAYSWERSGSFDRMFADLKADDMDPNDNIMKLREEEGLGLEGKVVIIQGTTDTIFLPNSVSSPYGTTPHRSLPVACGIIYKNFETPSDTTDDSGTVSEPSQPTPNPTPEPNPVPNPEYPDHREDGGVITPPAENEDNNEDGSWYDRLRDWLRNRF